MPQINSPSKQNNMQAIPKQQVKPISLQANNSSSAGKYQLKAGSMKQHASTLKQKKGSFRKLPQQQFLNTNISR